MITKLLRFLKILAAISFFIPIILVLLKVISITAGEGELVFVLAIVEFIIVSVYVVLSFFEKISLHANLLKEKGVVGAIQSKASNIEIIIGTFSAIVIFVTACYVVLIINSK